MNRQVAHAKSETFASNETARQINVLIIDDDGFDRQRIMRMCNQSDLPVQCTELSTVDKLAEVLDAQSFDLILVDFSLGSGNGLDVLKDIKAHPTNKAANTIMITGSWVTENSRAAIALGCGNYVEKDFLESRTIQRALEKAAGTANHQLPQDYEAGAGIAPMEAGKSDSIEALMEDFDRNISPGMTDWIERIDDLKFGTLAMDKPATLVCLSEIEASYLRFLNAAAKLRRLSPDD